MTVSLEEWCNTAWDPTKPQLMPTSMLVVTIIALMRDHSVDNRPTIKLLADELDRRVPIHTEKRA